jgi:thymidine phosphorylase
VIVPLHAPEGGFLFSVDARAIGNAVIELGGGRRSLNDVLDLSVGFTDIVPVGTHVDADRPLAMVHAADSDSAARASRLFIDACRFAREAPPERPVVYRIMTAD